MKSKVLFCLPLVLTLGAVLCAGQTADWEQRAEARAGEIIAKNGPGTDLALKQKLLAMYAKDQDVRNRMLAVPPERRSEFDAELNATDKKTTRELKKIVAHHGWPTVALVGAQASQAAAVMLVHSADHSWQEQMLPQLQKLVDTEKIFGSDVAGLTDRILVAQGKPQRFGTQFKTVNGKISIWPVEDPEHLEERRARYLLPPMDVYRKMLSDMYHMPLE